MMNTQKLAAVPALALMLSACNVDERKSALLTGIAPEPPPSSWTACPSLACQILSFPFSELVSSN